MKKMLFVYNPNSGKTQINDHLSKVVQTLTKEYEVVIYPTKERMDAHRVVLESDGRFDVIACSGGDGTLNEVVSAVMEHKNPPVVGYIPSGSTNDYAKTLGISSDMVKAATDIVMGNHVSCDVGLFNGRYYNYVAAFGAFTEVSYATSQEIKNLLGRQAYLIEGIKSLPYIKPMHMTIEVNGEVVEGDFLYGMITNTKSVGGFANAAGRDVELNDGLFEITFVRQIDDLMDFNKLMTALLNRNFTSPMIYHVKAGQVKITSAEPIPWVLDGEFGGVQQEVDVKIIKNAFRIIVPKDDN